MGTNFYVKIKLTEDQKKSINEYLSKDDYKSARDILDNTNDIHIGKHSYGWKFLWNVNNFKYFGKSKKEIFDWLKDKDITQIFHIILFQLNFHLKDLILINFVNFI